MKSRWMKISADAPLPEGVEIEVSEDGDLWRPKPQKTVTFFELVPDPEAAARLEAKREAQFERHVIEVMKARYLAEFDDMAERDPPDETIEELRAKLLEVADALAEAKEPDPRDEELVRLRAQNEALKARSLELEDANDTLKDALALAEDELDAQADVRKFPASLDEKLVDYGTPAGVTEGESSALKAAMEEGETVAAAKRRLYPILNDELSRLKNQEALLGASTPESVSARRKDVESLLGILARVGDA